MLEDTGEWSEVLTSSVARDCIQRVRGALTKDLFKNPSFPEQIETTKGEKKYDHYHMKYNKIIPRLYELLCNLIKPQLLFLVCLPCLGWSRKFLPWNP